MKIKGYYLFEGTIKHLFYSLLEDIWAKRTSVDVSEEEKGTLQSCC
jgi:hypothetical protein